MKNETFLKSNRPATVKLGVFMSQWPHFYCSGLFILEEIKMKEVFKDIPGYEGYYQVSNLGNVKSLERTIIRSNGRKQHFKERILKAGIEDGGYRMIVLYKNRKRNFKISHLVAMAFLGHKQDGTLKIVVDHIDNNKLNDNLSNLQLISQRENVSKDTWRHGKTSKYVGVNWHKGAKKWVASIRTNRKLKYLGYFTSEIEASNAYQKELQNIIKP